MRTLCKFKVGDRVVYTGNAENNVNWKAQVDAPLGKTAIVQKLIKDDQVDVKWEDTSVYHTTHCFSDNFDLINLVVDGDEDEDTV